MGGKGRKCVRSGKGGKGKNGTSGTSGRGRGYGESGKAVRANGTSGRGRKYVKSGVCVCVLDWRNGMVKSGVDDFFDIRGGLGRVCARV